MKTKVITTILLLVTLIALILHNKNDLLNSKFQSKLAPIKMLYKDTTNNIKGFFEDYIGQKNTIEKYKKENEELKLQLSNQLNYIDESKKLYKVFPSLRRIKLDKNVDMVQAISYIKFNNFSQIILTKPNKIQEHRIYGLLQNGVVGGVARFENDQLVGYLPNDEKSRFSVFVGKDNAPGIAIGSGSKYSTIQFIPKWFDIKVGDKVITSGLDGIFYSNIPVGVVNKVELQGSFKVAQMDIYSDAFHPKIFYLIRNLKPVLFNSNLVNYSHIPTGMAKTAQIEDINKSLTSGQKPAALSSSPLVEIDQTKDYEIDTTKQTPQNDQTNRQAPETQKAEQPVEKSQSNQENTNENKQKNNLEMLNTPSN